MKDFECNSTLERVTYLIEFQIRKHGNYGCHTTVEEAVNGMSQYELLKNICDYLDETVFAERG